MRRALYDADAGAARCDTRQHAEKAMVSDSLRGRML
jgi:hypothetical protein